MRLAVLVLLAGCAKGTSFSSDAPPAGDGAPDDGETAADARPGSNSRAPLVTEVVLTPTMGELIEITNPTGQVIDLTSYYLSDSGNYFRLPAGATVDPTDFIVKFPAGAMVAARSTITIAIDTAANFQAVHGVAPTYSIASGTMMSVVANGSAQLTNGGELVVLFEWSGSDLVHDCDLTLAGVPTAANGLVNKSGVPVDGPDADSMTTTYSTDARTITNQALAPGSGVSTKRITGEAGNETQAGTGNGLGGDDETSENTSATWDTTYSAPTPGTVPSTVLM